MNDETQSDNLALWKSVEKTDPKYTKAFPGKGGFKGTAICAQWQRWKATELWGPYGSTWGLREDVFKLMPLSNDFHDTILVYTGQFFYPEASCFWAHAEIDVWTYVRKGEYWTKNNDIHKKVHTDALTKALSMLGFSADVFLGLFDDNKYVQEVGAAFNEARTEEAAVHEKMAAAKAAEKAEKAAAAATKAKKEDKQRLADWTCKVDECTSLETLRATLDEARNVFRKHNCAEEYKELVRIVKIKGKEIEKRQLENEDVPL